MTANIILRKKAAAKGVRMWQIAEKMGFSESYFCRLMRHDLPEDKQKQVLEIIDTLAADQEVEP